MLEYDEKRYADICQVKMKFSTDSPEDLVGVAGLTKVQSLTKEKDGSIMIYSEGKPKAQWITLAARAGGFLYPPFELTPDKWRLTFIGSERQVRKFLKILDRISLKYEIALSAEAHFSMSTSYLSMLLTPQQRKAITFAHEQGYYEIPRRTDSREIARRLKLSKSTLAQYIREAEKRLLDEILSSY